MGMRAWRNFHQQTHRSATLTPLLWLGRMHAHRSQYQEVTRLFAALSMGVSELVDFYHTLDFTLTLPISILPLYHVFHGRKQQGQGSVHL
jgi:hypothetical protein